MTSLAPARPPSSSSNRSTTPSSQPNHVFRHQHSLSSSTPSNQHFGALSPRYGPPRSAGGPRQNLDNNKHSLGNPPISPRLPPGSAGNSMRPNSEMLGLANQQHGGSSLEAEAIDKWFEDLQTYEATLEEMAAASLDASFKEELSAIEQWFRVLSEAERTAALYSLLQSSTQVQIRFFITVLQQMARSDPMTALLSPAPTGAAGVSMKQQMEAKLAQLSKISPASPIVRQFARQSLGTNMSNSSNEPYLSPNSALLSDSNNYNGGANSGPNDAAALLASQRAKLQSKAANRVSAPGQLLGDYSLKSPKWGNFPGPVEEEPQSRSTSPRPRSTSNEVAPASQQNSSHPTFSRTLPSPNTVNESQLSPAVGGSWASQVNTPLVPMFTNKEQSGNHPDNNPQQDHVESAANRLAQWGASHQASSNSASLPASALASKTDRTSGSQLSGIQLDDARKFRRQSKSTASASANGFSGVLSGMNNSTNNSHNSTQTQPLSANNSQSGGQAGGFSRTMPSISNTSNVHLTGLSSSSGPALPSPMTPQSLLGTPQGNLNPQQNWRHGLNSPSVQPLTSPDPIMLNNLAMMNTLAGLNGGVNMNGIANLAAMANIADPAALQNMANILNMRQQIQQVQSLQALQQQLQQNGMIASMMNPNPLISPAGAARMGMNFTFPMGAAGATGAMNGNKRAAGPGGRAPAAKLNHTPGSGANPDEDLDMKLLEDIPAWLRGLRLHKYTPNFEGCTWKEMVLMNDSDLENRGVAAIGARRKMLRTFETVRLKTGMSLPGDGEHDEESNFQESGNVDKIEDENDQPTTNNTSLTPESDQ